MGNDSIYGGKAKSKICVFSYVLKVASEMAEETDSGKYMERFTNLRVIYSAKIPDIEKLSGTLSKSVLNSKIDEAVPQRQQVIRHAGVYGGMPRSKRYVLRHFLKVETEVD